MSVSIALLPIALAMRIVMGKKNFENFVESYQVRVPTNFGSELDLCQAVKKAGYDAIKFGSSIKTHLQGEQMFFFWELVDGKWQAIFAKGHQQAILNIFMADVERAVGYKVFGVTSLPEVFSEVNLPVTTLPQYPTNFRDGALLMEALTEFGAKPVRNNDGQIICQIDNSKMVFTQTADEPYRVEVTNAPALEEVYHYLSDIDEDYKRCVQTAVYEKLKSRAQEKNMTIESEEVMEDNSIVLTLNVQNARV
jgi:hypothetical protein